MVKLAKFLLAKITTYTEYNNYTCTLYMTTVEMKNRRDIYTEEG